MSLPKLNNAPKYELTVPSTKELITFRPFLVKEEKILMMAVESEDQAAAVRAVVDTIDSCVDGGIEKEKLTTFDVEYLFTQIRAKSVGETAKIALKCQKCEEENEVHINLDEITVTWPDPAPSGVIDLGNDIKLHMKWPKYYDVVDSGVLTGEGSLTNQTFSTLLKCIDAVETADERVRMADETEAEQMSFVEQLTKAQLDEIQKFIEAIPKMQSEIKYACTKCGHDNQIHLEGMQNFF